MRRPNRRRNLSRSIPPLPQTDSLAASNGNRAQDSRPELRWYMPPLLLDWQRISFYENRRDARRDRPAWCDPCNPPGACHGIRSPFCVKCLIIKTARAPLSPDEQQRNRKREDLLLSRKRLTQQLQAAGNPRHRQMLEQAIAELDRQ